MQTDPSNLKGYGIFVPFVLLLLSVVTWFAFQTSQLISERTNLTALKSSQETVYQNAQKMRAQLDSLAAGTARLSEKGNSNATSVVAALRARGISINPGQVERAAQAIAQRSASIAVAQRRPLPLLRGLTFWWPCRCVHRFEPDVHIAFDGELLDLNAPWCGG